eukprot:536242_1
MNNTKCQRTTKVKTQILLNDNDEVVAFGDNAKIIYSSLSGNERRKWKFFDRFKMSLYEVDIKPRVNANAQQNACHQEPSIKQPSIINVQQCVPMSANSFESRQDVDNECKQNILSGKQSASFYMVSMNGSKCKPDIVFTSAFRHLQKIALEYMDKITDSKSIKVDEIQWIMTVPAIWSEKAKYQMKKWIVNAGLIDTNIKDQCLIVYESDCAALAMFQESKQQKITE